MAQSLENKKTAEEVQWENRIAFQKAEHERLLKAKDVAQSEIDRKTSEYEIYMAQKDSANKKMRQECLDANEQLAKDKQEFQGILQQFNTDKAAFAESKKMFEVDKLKTEAKANNIQQFIIAVQRAYSLLGL